MADLSERDQQIYEFLQRYSSKRGAAPAPSYREIVAACSISSTALVKKSLRRLVEAKLIEWYPGVARSIRVLPRVEQSAVVSRSSEQAGEWA